MSGREHRRLLERRDAMESFIHQENLILFRKRLAETKDDATRQVMLRLLAEEKAKDLINPYGQGDVSAGRPPNAA